MTPNDRRRLLGLVGLVLALAVACKEKDSLPLCVEDQRELTEGLSEVDALAVCLSTGLDFSQFEDPAAPGGAQAACEAYAESHGGFADIRAEACVIALTPPIDAPPEPDATPEDASPFDASPFDASPFDAGPVDGA